jgi:hypothetical protein
MGTKAAMVDLTNASSSNPAADNSVWDALIEVDDALDVLERKYEEEQKKIAETYETKRAPLLEKRNTMASQIPRFWSTAVNII